LYFIFKKHGHKRKLGPSFQKWKTSVTYITKGVHKLKTVCITMPQTLSARHAGNHVETAQQSFQHCNQQQLDRPDSHLFVHGCRLQITDGLTASPVNIVPTQANSACQRDPIVVTSACILIMKKYCTSQTQSLTSRDFVSLSYGLQESANLTA
jgi:hypothetical protein